MNPFEAELSERLADIRQQGLYRELRRVDSEQSPRIRIGGQTLLNFSSNDYLGLANEPALREAAARCLERYGAGAGASRLICGSLAPYHELEETLAAFKGTESALTFATGYAAAIGTVGALIGRDDIIIVDKLAHACLVDAARLSGAKLRVFAHNDLNELEEILKWSQARLLGPKSAAENRHPRALIITESVFSMDGDQAPLNEIVALKERYGAWLMVDEAHATGLYGANRRGLCEELGVSDHIEVQMGTLGKALGAAGGYICGSRLLVDYLVNRARTFIFSTAPVPAAAAAATAALQFVRSSDGESRRTKVWERVARFAPTPGSTRSFRPGAIIPIPIGDETAAVETAAALRERGIYIPAIRFPTVARGAARLRLTITAAHTNADIDQLITALQPLGLGPRVPGFASAEHAPAG